MQAAQIIETVHAAGGQLAMIDGELKGKNLTDFTRQIVKRHKTEIIYLLLDEIPPEPRQALATISKPGKTRSTSRLRARISENALTWLQDHRQELRAAGWTPAELYRRNKSKGFAWLKIWCRPGLNVTLAHDGSIVFRYVNKIGSPIKQTAFPRRKYISDGLK